MQATTVAMKLRVTFVNSDRHQHYR